MNIIINVEYALQYVDHTFDSLLNSVTSFTKRKLPKWGVKLYQEECYAV